MTINNVDINKLLDILKSSLIEPTTAISTHENPLSFENCSDILNEFSVLHEVLLEFETKFDHKDFVAKLTASAKHVQEIEFNPPLDTASDEQLFKGLADIGQLLDAISDQEKQMQSIVDIAAGITEAERIVKTTICSTSGPNIDGKTQPTTF